ncbi:MAG: Bax inhibitor-1/YccA family protein [Muribaculaceae bacterium]|nr:Bax inhibitor-1/YccA family protein [Muribaculaceae bacterium]
MNNYDYNLDELNAQRGYQPIETQRSLSGYLSKVMRSVYLRMFLGLLATAFTSLYIASNEALVTTLFSSQFIFFGLMIAELAVVIILSSMINKMSTAMATALFYLYAVLNGVVFTSILFVYSPAVIFKTFLITAGTFAAMSIFGYTTKQDLSKFGTYMVMALIGLIVCSIVNIFLKSSGFDWLISLAGVAIFVGLTAWDTQKIKAMAMATDEENVGKLATMGALSLYLDFINLFLYLLRIFGRER